MVKEEMEMDIKEETLDQDMEAVTLDPEENNYSTGNMIFDKNPQVKIKISEFLTTLLLSHLQKH